MDASIDSGGSTMATYLRADGTRGDYLEKFAKVFRREGLACERCGAEIKKIRVAGRGTHICPNCQRICQEIKKHKPEFEMIYDVDPLKQSIADSWPDSLDDSCARQEWDWAPRYGLAEMTTDMLEKLTARLK